MIKKVTGAVAILIAVVGIGESFLSKRGIDLFNTSWINGNGSNWIGKDFLKPNSSLLSENSSVFDEENYIDSFLGLDLREVISKPPPPKPTIQTVAIKPKAIDPRRDPTSPQFDPTTKYHTKTKLILEKFPREDTYRWRSYDRKKTYQSNISETKSIYDNTRFGRMGERPVTLDCNPWGETEYVGTPMEEMNLRFWSMLLFQTKTKFLREEEQVGEEINGY